MKGLCHFCNSSNIELSVIKGEIRCIHCVGKKITQTEKKKLDKLPFEDLPQASEQERLDNIERVSADVMERSFARYIKNERLSEPLIDRIHDT